MECGYYALTCIPLGTSDIPVWPRLFCFSRYNGLKKKQTAAGGGGDAGQMNDEDADKEYTTVSPTTA